MAIDFLFADHYCFRGTPNSPTMVKIRPMTGESFCNNVGMQLPLIIKHTVDGCERLHQLVGGETLVIIPLSVSCFLKSAKRYKKGCRISQPSTACMKRVLLCGLPTKYIQKRIRCSNFTSAKKGYPF